MKKTSNPIIQRAGRLLAHLTRPVFLLLWAALLIYGIFIPLLGFYWDDLAIQWISQVYGTDGLARYFSTNRPFWGLFYQFSTSMLGREPWQWQAFGLFWRWVCAVSLYFLVRQVWRGRREPALVAAFVFLVYPGFGQQFIATVYGHFFIVLSAFFFSLGLSLFALQNNRWRPALIAAAALFSAVNVFSMEYFFMLELLRPLFFWVVLSQQGLPLKERIKTIILNWLPYLAVFMAAGVWRAFIFNYQTENYRPETLALIRSQPFLGIWQLLLTVLNDLWQTALAAWGRVFLFPDWQRFGERATLLYLGSMFALLVLIAAAFWAARFRQEPAGGKAFNPWKLVVLGLLALLPAGIPFWLTGLPVYFNFPNDRFTLPFILGSSLIFSGVLFALPFKPWLRRIVFVLLITLAGGLQVQNGVAFQRDWEQQQRMFWQMAWRMPSLEPGTILFAQELPLQYFSDNSLSSTVNWTYAPYPRADHIPYILYYPTIRTDTGLATFFAPDEIIEKDLLIGRFFGNTSQTVVFYYEPPACLRVLDPQIEVRNWMVPVELREVMHLSSTDPIQSTPQAQPPLWLYGPEPQPNWCYYFEKADLARQQQNWPEVVRLAELAFNLNDNPNDPAERLPFIEGYAHTGAWQAALEQTHASADISPVMQPVLCDLWQRIQAETPPGEGRDQTLQAVHNELECNFPLN